MLELKNISYSIGRKKILKGISTSFHPGRITMILGPNGSGKSSLLRIFSGEHRNYNGEIWVDGKPLSHIPPGEYARFRAVLSQHPHLQFPLSVEEVVMMGRYPFFRNNPSSNDLRVCEEAMKLLDIREFAGRDYLTLSGGEKQRVQYARILAQIWEKPQQGLRCLFLDEPLNSLDMRYQQEFLSTARQFLDEQMIIVVVIHDINLALRFGDNFLFMKNGELAAGGDRNIVTPQLIHNVFGVHSTVTELKGQQVVVLH